MKLISRRNFLRYALGFSSLSLLPRLSFSQSPVDDSQFVILVSFGGGWDISLGPDAWSQAVRPSESEYFLEYRQDELVPFGDSFVGPGMTPMMKYFKNLTVFNGVFLSKTDLGHPLLRYSQTGQGQGELATFSAQFSETKGKIGLGVLSTGSDFVAGKNIPLLDLNDLQRSDLTEAKAFSLKSKSQTDIWESQRQIRTMLPQIQSFNQTLAPLRSANSGAATIGQVLGQAFKEGLSFGATVDVEDLATDSSNPNIDFDTHSNHERMHLSSMKMGFEGLAKLMDDLNSVQLKNGETVLSKTTIVVVSDFARTPAMNASRGKDHNPQTNSMLVWNQKWKGSQIVGASRLIESNKSRIGIPYLSAIPVDQVSKKPALRREGVFTMRPDHIYASVYKSLGLDPVNIHPGFKELPSFDHFLMR